MCFIPAKSRWDQRFSVLRIVPGTLTHSSFHVGQDTCSVSPMRASDVREEDEDPHPEQGQERDEGQGMS